MARSAVTTGDRIRFSCERLFERLELAGSLTPRNFKRLCMPVAGLPLPTVSWLLITLLVSRQRLQHAELAYEHILRPVLNMRNRLHWPGSAWNDISGLPMPPVELLRVRRSGFDEGQELIQVGIETVPVKEFGRLELHDRVRAPLSNHPAVNLGWYALRGFPVEPAWQDLLQAKLVEEANCRDTGTTGWRLSSLLLEQADRIQRFYAAWAESRYYEHRMQLAGLIGDWPYAYYLVAKFAPRRSGLLGSLSSLRSTCVDQLQLRRGLRAYFDHRKASHA